MKLPQPNQLKYLSTGPFPHLVIDDVFSEKQINALIAHWPTLPKTKGYEKFQQLRSGTTDERIMGKWISDFVKINFHSRQFIEFLEELSGITGLILDPREIGLHQTLIGGHLQPHIDYPINKVTGLEHRVNVLLYLSENCGGNLELYDEKKRLIVSVAPRLGRMVIFNVANAWHGHPKKAIATRKSIAMNYFTAPNGAVHSTETVYALPKWSQFVPPIFFKLLHKLKK